MSRVDEVRQTPAEDVEPAISVSAAYKIFGRRAGAAVAALSQGAHRDEVAHLNVTAAVVDAEFDVRHGEIFVVMGLSGSGKSTLIRMLNGLLRPTSGEILVDGVGINRLPAPRLRKLRQDKISMVFQHFALLPHRTVLENVAFGLEIANVPAEQRRVRSREAVELVGLSGWEDHLPTQLSGGMKQRVGLARALAVGTEIMLMDEAFSALDPLIRREMQDQLLSLQQRLGKTVVFITHDLNEAMRLGDRIAMMRDGRIVQIGTAEEILARPADEYVAEFIADVDRIRVLTATAVMQPPAAGARRDASAHEVAENTSVAELFGLYTDGRRSVNVVDAEGALVGVVPQTSLLQVLAEYAAVAEPTTAVDRDGGR